MGGGAGEIQKKEFAQGKIKRKKILARQLTRKNIHTMAKKTIHTRNLITKKIPAARKFPSPHTPITFLVPKAHVHDELFCSFTLIRIVKVITTNLNG